MPLTDAEVAALFRNRETERAERKRSSADRDSICEAICAFSNDLPDSRAPGVVFIGQRDDGSCADVDIEDKTLREVGGWRDEGRIQPIPSMSVSRREIDGCTVAVVIVEPSAYPPVRYNGRTMIRVGPRRAVASHEEERRLVEKRSFYNLPFDTRPVAYSSVNDIDLVNFDRDYLPRAVSRDGLTKDNRSSLEKLQALRFADREGVPTASGILLLGSEPTAFLPGAYIQALRISGTELGGVIRDEQTISGSLANQLSAADRLIAIWNDRAVVIGGENVRSVRATLSGHCASLSEMPSFIATTMAPTLQSG